MDCAIDGTVNEANREVLAFDNTGATGVGSIAVDFAANLDSVGAVFDAMTMGVFNFNSSLVGFDAVFATLLALTVCVALTGLTGLTILDSLFFTAAISVFLTCFLTGSTITFADLSFKPDFATVLTITVLATGFAAFFAIGFTTCFAAAFLTGLANGFEIVLGSGFLTAFTGDFVDTFTDALTGFLSRG